MLLFSLNCKKLLGSNSLHMALTSVSPSSGGTAGTFRFSRAHLNHRDYDVRHSSFGSTGQVTTGCCSLRRHHLQSIWTVGVSFAGVHFLFAQHCHLFERSESDL